MAPSPVLLPLVPMLLLSNAASDSWSALAGLLLLLVSVAVALHARSCAATAKHSPASSASVAEISRHPGARHCSVPPVGLRIAPTEETRTMWHDEDCPVRAHTRYTLTAPWLSMRTSTVSGPAVIVAHARQRSLRLHSVEKLSEQNQVHTSSIVVTSTEICCTEQSHTTNPQLAGLLTAALHLACRVVSTQSTARVRLPTNSHDAATARNTAWRCSRVRVASTWRAAGRESALPVSAAQACLHGEAWQAVEIGFA